MSAESVSTLQNFLPLGRKNPSFTSIFLGIGARETSSALIITYSPQTTSQNPRNYRVSKISNPRKTNSPRFIKLLFNAVSNKFIMMLDQPHVNRSAATQKREPADLPSAQN
jgi:hypothetical protein